MMGRSKGSKKGTRAAEGTHGKRGQEDELQDFMELMEATCQGKATVAQERKLEALLRNTNKGYLDRMVHICYTLLAVRFEGSSEDGSAVNSRGPRLLFAFLNCFEGSGYTEPSEPCTPAMSEAYVNLIRRIAEDPEVEDDHCTSFEAALVKDKAFQKLYLVQEERYRRTSQSAFEARLRIYLVSRLALPACVVGPPWNPGNAAPMAVSMDREAILSGLHGTAVVQAERTTRQGATADIPSDLIGLVASGQANEATRAQFAEMVQCNAEFHSLVYERIQTLRTTAGLPHTRLQAALDGIDPAARAKTDSRTPTDQISDLLKRPRRPGVLDTTIPAVYRWRPRYEGSLVSLLKGRYKPRHRGLSGHIVAEQRFMDKRLDVGGLSSEMETTLASLPPDLPGNRWLEQWMSEALKYGREAGRGLQPPMRKPAPDARPTTAASGHRRAPGDSPGCEGRSSTIMAGLSSTRQQTRSTPDNDAPNMERLRLNASPVREPATTSTRAGGVAAAGPSQSSTMTVGEVQKISDAVQQDSRHASEMQTVAYTKLINKVAGTLHSLESSELFGLSYRGTPRFREQCDGWLTYYQKCTPKVAWINDRGRRLKEAVRRVRMGAALPPRGPPLLPGEVVPPEGDEIAQNMEEQRESQLMLGAGLLRPLEFSEPLRKYRQACQVLARATAAQYSAPPTSAGSLPYTGR